MQIEICVKELIYILGKWLSEIKLLTSLEKTKYMIFHARQRTVTFWKSVDEKYILHVFYRILEAII